MASISDLRSDHKNARKRTDRSATLIEESLKRYGAARSVVIDEDNRILAGNGTVDAAKRAGISKVRVIETNGDEIIAVKRTGLTEDQKIGLALADNRTSDLSEWDKEMLHQLSEEHDITPWFEAEDLAEIMGEVEVIPTEGLTDADDVPEPPADPITKPGDLWILGNHRLLCGDSTDVLAVQRLMDGQKADILFTDPPYGINFKPQRGTHGTILNDNLNGAEFDDFLDGVFSSALAVMKPDTYAFVWTGWSKIGVFERSLQKFFKIQAMHVWVKNNFGIGYYSRPKHEPFYLCLNGKPVYPNTAPADVWDYARVYKTVHSCEKPVGLIEDILNTYHKNSVVLDLFGGSGSTLIACEKTNRNSRLMELDPKYCDVIVKRWEDFTGKKAILEESQEAC
jgi:DNA modification methylase